MFDGERSDVRGPVSVVLRLRWRGVAGRGGAFGGIH